MNYKLTFIYCIIVLVLSVLPSNSFPKVDVSYADKIVHFLMYFFMIGVMVADSFLFYSKSAKFLQKTAHSEKPMTNKKLLYFFFFAVIFGVVIEIIQFFLPTRSAEWGDLLSNSIGAFVGISVIFFVKKLINFAQKFRQKAKAEDSDAIKSLFFLRLGTAKQKNKIC